MISSYEICNAGKTRYPIIFGKIFFCENFKEKLLQNHKQAEEFGKPKLNEKPNQYIVMKLLKRNIKVFTNSKNIPNGGSRMIIIGNEKKILRKVSS